MRKFGIALIVLAALLVAADFGTRAYAESRTADAVQAELGIASTPDVSIEGFPFLFHAASGQYPQVIITASDIDTAVLADLRATLTLSNVTLPLRDALAGNTSQLAAQSTVLQVLVPLSSLSAALGQANLTLSAAPDGSLAVTTSISVLGQTIPLTGTADLTVANDTLTVSVGSLSAAGVDLTPIITAAAEKLAGGLTQSFPLSGLPFTVTQADVAVAGGDVVLTGTTGPVLFSDLRR